MIKVFFNGKTWCAELEAAGLKATGNHPSEAVVGLAIDGRFDDYFYKREERESAQKDEEAVSRRDDGEQEVDEAA